MSQERAVRATEKSLMELAGKAEEASEVAAVSARQLPAKLEARTREVRTKARIAIHTRKQKILHIMHAPAADMGCEAEIHVSMQVPLIEFVFVCL